MLLSSIKRGLCTSRSSARAHSYAWSDTRSGHRRMRTSVPVCERPRHALSIERSQRVEDLLGCLGLPHVAEVLRGRRRTRWTLSLGIVGTEVRVLEHRAPYDCAIAVVVGTRGSCYLRLPRVGSPPGIPQPPTRGFEPTYGEILSWVGMEGRSHVSGGSRRAISLSSPKVKRTPGPLLLPTCRSISAHATPEPIRRWMKTSRGSLMNASASR